MGVVMDWCLVRCVALVAPISAISLVPNHACLAMMQEFLGWSIRHPLGSDVPTCMGSVLLCLAHLIKDHSRKGLCRQLGCRERTIAAKTVKLLDQLHAGDQSVAVETMMLLTAEYKEMRGQPEVMIENDDCLKAKPACVTTTCAQ